MKNLSVGLLFFAGLILLNTTGYSQVSFNTGPVIVEVDNWGALKLYTPAKPDSLFNFDRISVLVSGNENQVFDYWNDLGIADSVVLYDSLFKYDSLSEYDYEVTGSFNDSVSALPPNVLVNENIYGWKDASYIIIKYKITNLETSALNSSIGLDIIPAIDHSYDGDTIRFNPNNQTLYMYDQNFAALKLLNAETLSAYIFEWNQYYANNDTNYYRWMTTGIKDSALMGTDIDGSVAILSSALQNINPNESVELYFALALGKNEDSILVYMAQAQEKLTIITSVNEQDDFIPSAFNLNQNYPNPFNPSTKISFNLPTRENVSLKIYNILGQEVTALVNGEMEAGNHTIEFNASSLSSGVYIYQVTAGSYRAAKKMTLIK